MKKGNEMLSEIVYSTGKINKKGPITEEKLLPGQQQLKVFLDKKNRKGKKVTLVDGFIGTKEELRSLEKQLKQKCGVGGTVKDGIILIQGDHRETIVTELINKGYLAKIS